MQAIPATTLLHRYWLQEEEAITAVNDANNGMDPCGSIAVEMEEQQHLTANLRCSFTACCVGHSRCLVHNSHERAQQIRSSAGDGLTRSCLCQ